MKIKIFLTLACLMALNGPVSSVLDFSLSDLIAFSPSDLKSAIKDCLTNGFSKARSILDFVNLRKSGSCRRGDVICNAKNAAHTFKIAAFESNLASICQGQGLLQASKLFKETFNIPASSIQSVLSRLHVDRADCANLFAACAGFEFNPRPVSYTTSPCGTVIPECANNRYREIDGYCNNLIDLDLGTPFRPFLRLIAPDYADGIDAPRGSNSNTLPPPRLISQVMMGIPASTRPQISTQMVKLWGQFLDHDLTRTPESSGGITESGETLLLECCEEGEIIDAPNISPECIPLTIPEDDEYFLARNVECLPFVRSLPSDTGCKLGPREQTNEITAFHDGSNVYGSTEEKERSLRSFVDGHLLTSDAPETVVSTCPAISFDLFLLPPDVSEDPSFIAGDTRSNEQPSLAAMHTVWIRVHNRIADILGSTRVASDETIFQETRRIVGALMQHITYSQFLPFVVGFRFMDEYGLKPLPGSRYTSLYNPYINPTIANVFATAAFRFGHTLIDDDMGGIGNFSLGDNFFTAGTLFMDPDTQPSSIIREETVRQALPTDAVLDDVLTQRLALGPPEDIAAGFPDHGNDLMALNIMRGRDHGLPGYNAWRKLCGLREITNFAQMRNFMDPETADVMAGLYNSVDDVDLFPAAMAENPAFGGGILGNTFSCIIAMQFSKLKYGDRFFYENSPFVHNNNQEIAFTPPQLRMIKTTKLAEILCEVTCVEEYSDNVFFFDPNQDKIICGQQRSEVFVALENDAWF